MALETMTKLQSVTLTGTQSSIDFTSIPQGYTDLCLIVSVRGTNTTLDNLSIQYNGDTSSSYKYTEAIGTGSSTSGGAGTATSHNTLLLGSSSTVGTFTNHKLYIYNYSGNSAKNTSVESAVENNAASTLTQMRFQSWRWDKPSPITSIKLFNSTYSFVQYSTATLYGIKNVRQTVGNSIKATGGNIIFDGTYVYHTFRDTGTFTPYTALLADALVIAGGGGGGMAYGGGGGAGGLRYFSSQALTATNYTVTVGGGGSGNSTNISGTNGSNSQFGVLTLSTGGGGGGGDGANGLAGGSGGGGSNTAGGAASPSGQGNIGGNGASGAVNNGDGGGGGGAGAAGSNASTNVSGNGGIGSSAYSSWASATSTGVAGYYAAGGGGGGGTSGGHSAGAGGTGGGGNGTASTGAAGTGVANTGSGGGGAGYTYSSNSGNGGSGIVIIRYKG